VAVYYLNAYSEFRRIHRDLTEKERALIFSLSQPEPPTVDTHPLSPSEVTKLLKAGKIGLPPATAALFQDEKPGYSYFSFHDEAGHVLLRSKNAPSNLLPLAAPARGAAEETRTIGTRREFCHSSDQGLLGIVGRDISPELGAMRRFGWSLALAGVSVWMLGLIVGWWLAGGALRPIQTCSHAPPRRGSATHCQTGIGNLFP
jgi:two-component system, OmpR family, sensor kinase